MKACYISEGKIEEINIPKGGHLIGDFRIERRNFGFKNEEEDQIGMYIFKGEERLAVVFFNHSIMEPCAMKFNEHLCFRLQALNIIGNVIEHWHGLVQDLPNNHMIKIPINKETK